MDCEKAQSPSYKTNRKYIETLTLFFLENAFCVIIPDERPLIL